MNKKSFEGVFSALYAHKNLALAGIFVFMGVLFFSNANEVFAVTAGPNNPTHSDSINIDQPWSTYTNIYSSDDAHATAALGDFNTSDYLVADNFGFSIPTGSTINGVVVTVERSASSASRIADGYLSLLDAGSPSGDNKADTGTPWGTTDSVATYGSSGDTWSNSLTPAFINDSGFGVWFRADSIASKGANANVDHIQITVYYTPPYQTTSTQTGNWNIGTTWGGSCASSCTAGVHYPDVTESVTIAAGHTVTLTGTQTTVSATINGTGTLSLGSNTLILTGSGSPLIKNGTFSAGTGTTRFTGTSTTTIPENVTFYNLEVMPGANSVTHVLNTDMLPIGGNLVLGDGSHTGTTTTAYGQDIVLDIAGNITNNSGNTFISSDVNGMFAGGSWTNYGTFTDGGTGVVFDSSSSGKTITTGGSAFATLTFNNASGAWTFQDNVTTSTLSVVAGTLNASSRTVTITGSGTPFTRSGTVNFDTSTFVFTSTSGATLHTGVTYYNLTIAPASGTTPTFYLNSFTSLNGDLTINGVSGTVFNASGISSNWFALDATDNVHGNVVIGTGNTFIAPSASGTLYVNKDFTNNGTFTHSSGTVELRGGLQANITGSNTFYNLRANTAGKAIRFAAGSTTTINGLLTLTGGSGNNITLNSSTGSSSWTINHQGTESITYTTVTYSACHGSSTTITASSAGNTDGGNNGVCWTFPIAYNLTSSQTGNWNLGTTWGGACSSSCTAGVHYPNTNESVTIASGHTVTLTASQQAVSVVISGSATLSLGSNTLTLSGSGTPLTRTGSFSAGTGQVIYTSASGISAFSSAAMTGSNKYYHLTINGTGTFTQGVDIEVGAAFTAQSGSFVGSGTATMNNGSSISTISGSFNFNNLTIASGATMTSGSSFTISGALTNSSTGVFSHSSGNITFNNGASIVNSGTTLSFRQITIANSATVTANTSYTVNEVFTIGSSATLTATSGTVTMNNGSSITNSGSLTFFNLTTATSATVTANTNYTVAGVLTIGSSATLAPNAGTITLSGTGTPISNSGTFTPSGSNVIQFTGTSANVTPMAYAGLTLGAGSAGVYTMPVTSMSIKGSLVVSNNATVTKGAGTIQFAGTDTQVISDANATKQDLGALQISSGFSGDAWCDLSTVCNTSWLNRLKITMNNSALSGNLTNFPILVSLTSSNIDYSKTQNEGQDIRFVDTDGTALSYQIEKWDESGTSTVWVKVPTVSNNNTDYFYLYYNNVSAADAQTPTSVWDSSYRGVWHLPNGSSLTLGDSTSNSITGSNSGATATTGKVGGGASFSGTSQSVNLTNNAALQNTTGTIEAWVKTSGAGSSYRGVIVKQYSHGLFLKDNVATVYDWGTGTEQNVGSALNDNQWHHLAFTFQNGVASGSRIYIDGNAVGSAYTYNVNNNGTALVLGAGSTDNSTQLINGQIDEARSSNTVRSADWIKATYNTGNNTMNSFGSEESQSAAGVQMGSSIKVTSLTIDTGKSFNVNGANTLTLTGNGASVFVPTGTFSQSTGTVEFASTGTSGTTIPAFTYNNLTINRASNVFTAGGVISANNFTITAGTFVAPASTLTLQGNFTNNGTFTHNSGTVVIAPVLSDKLTQFLGSSSTTFNNFTAAAQGAELRFKSGLTYNFSNTLTLTGANSEPILLSSDVPGVQWFVTLGESQSLNFVRVKDGGCSGGNTLSNSGNSRRVYNGGNNASCWGFISLGGVSGGSGGSSGSGSSSGGCSVNCAGGGGGASVQATATANRSTGTIASVTVNNAGSGYTQAPAICFQDATGSGATATATLSNGTVTGITVTAPGSNYSAGVTVGIAAPPGTGGSGCSSGSGQGGGGGGGGGASP